MFGNEYATLSVHKSAFKGCVTDYVIKFKNTQSDIQNVLGMTFDLFEQVIDEYKGELLKGRLIARVNYHRTSTNEDVSYFHTSYTPEHIENCYDFFERHIEKIAQRMEIFHKNGSSLLILNISQIHIQITKC